MATLPRQFPGSFSSSFRFEFFTTSLVCDCYSFCMVFDSLEILNWYFKGRLEELSTIKAGDKPCDDEDEDERDDMELDEKCRVSYRSGQMEIDECYPQGRFFDNNKLVNNIGRVVHDLRSLGFTSMTEDAYASAIFLFLKVIILCSVVFNICPAFTCYLLCLGN